MDRLKSILKPEFATVRQLESKGYGLFKLAGIIGIVSLIVTMCLTFLAWISIPGLGISILLFFLGMVWMSWLGKEQSRVVFCPYCASKMDVFMSRTELDCDMCERPIKMTPNGEPIAVEEDIMHKKY
ncbi:MAG: hypothetical protein Q7N50_08815 [Armatimonadota bacterium]|nr:hypothetical protein [Armatimonadota bacterium]